MASFFDDVESFHRRFGLGYDGAPRDLPGDPIPEAAAALLYEALDVLRSTREQVGGLHRFRVEFLLEELIEYLAADAASDLAEQLDALVDLVYVALGTATLQGFDFNEAWRRVHAANMRKVRAEIPADSKRGSTFDVVKPVGWEPARLDDLVDAERWEARRIERSARRVMMPGGRRNPFIEEEDEPC